MGTIALGFLSANLPLLAFEGQPSASDGDLQEDRRRLVIMTQELLKAAKERLEDQRQQVAQQRRKQVVEQAQRLAVRLAKEKAQQQAKRDQQAQRQLQLARGRNIKLLYQRGLAFYRLGAYAEAIEIFQQLPLIDPTHPLVSSAQHLLLEIEMKQRLQQQRQMATAPSQELSRVTDLERQLNEKRMELETNLKYAKQASYGGDHARAVDLLSRVLAQDPSNRQAEQLMNHVQAEMLKQEQTRLEQKVDREDQMMVNEVLKHQLLPAPVQSLRPLSAVSYGQLQRSMESKLREPLSFQFDDVALGDVLEFLADGVGVSIIPSPELDLKGRRVSIKAQDMPLEMAIKYLAKSQSLTWRIDDDVILLATQEQMSHAPMETRVFFLRNGLGPYALEASAVEGNPVLAMEPLKELIEKAIPQPANSKLVIDERSGALIMSNTSENLALTEQLLSQLDVTPVQVLIETRFIELVMTELEQLAMESVLTGNVSLSKKGDPDLVSRGAGHQLNSGSGFKFPALAREDEGLNLTLQGVLTGTQFETVLHMLDETKKSKTLSSPRVTTLNNKTAAIRVVDEFRYPTRYEVSLVQFDINGDGDFDDAGETEFANVPQDLQARDIGILLYVTPSIGKDLKTITLVLAPEVSQFSQFRNLGGGVTVPEFTSSQLTTSVVIEDGQTVMLGGLMTDSTSEDTTKIPVLGDLPLIGGLFRQSKETSTRKNLIIFITARVLSSRGQTT